MLGSTGTRLPGWTPSPWSQPATWVSMPYPITVSSKVMAGAAGVDSAPAITLDDIVIGYGMLAQGAARVAGWLQELGVQPGDRVGVDAQRPVLPDRLLRGPAGRRRRRADERAAEGRARSPSSCRDSGPGPCSPGTASPRRPARAPRRPARSSSASTRRSSSARSGPRAGRRGRARRRGHRGHPLHLGHDRHAEGRRADPRQPARATPRSRGRPVDIGADDVVLGGAAAVPLVRPDGRHERRARASAPA